MAPTSAASSIDWREALFSRRLLGVRQSNAAIEQVLDAMLPGLRERPPFLAVQIVGTNGKGSSSAMLDHGLRCASARRSGPVGLFTSPHLERVGERIRVDGQPLDDAEIVAGFAEVERAEAAVGASLSFFEVLTAIGLVTFVRAGCEIVVLEAGLGGRLDATTVVPRVAVGVSRVAMDHELYLGDNLAAIAREKAAVIAAGMPVFSVAQAPEVQAVLEARAREQAATLTFVEPLSTTPGDLLGDHQRHNGALALALLRTLEPEATAAWFDGVRWPGRLELLEIDGGRLWLDVAHNLDGIETLLAALAELGIEPDVIVFGAMADKPATAMAARLRERAPLWLVRPASEGSYALEDLARDGEPVYASAREDALRAALGEALARGACVLACGSHFIVGALRAWADGRREFDGPELSDPVARTGGRV